jgi:hypothetical protein
MRQRDGSNQLVLVAKALVALVVVWQTQIRARYGTSTAVTALLDAILALIPLLAQAEPLLVERGGDNADIVADPEQTPGLDPLAPVAPALPE